MTFVPRPGRRFNVNALCDQHHSLFAERQAASLPTFRTQTRYIMADRSLQSSIWAPGNRPTLENRQHSSFVSTDDWSCASCSFSNFQWRKECFRCFTPRFGHHQKVLPVNGHSATIYTEDSTSSRKIELELSTTKAQHLPISRQQPEFKAAEKGLATSQWAPRRQSRGEAQVWTRVRCLRSELIIAKW